MLLDNDLFLYELTKMFTRARTSGKGSVLITTKQQKHFGKAKEAAVPQMLYRATLARKKISTTVSAVELEKFSESYGNVLKANIDNLKRKDRKKKRATVE
eukprot:m.78003 g.78003  ORF g.78003 m.78003 type:complete len:100 (-) comp16207_c0_seq1:960-1259(-)